MPIRLTISLIILCSISFSQTDSCIFFPTGEIKYRGTVCGEIKCGTWYLYGKDGDTISRIEMKKNGKDLTMYKYYNRKTHVVHCEGYFLEDSIILNGYFYSYDSISKWRTEGFYKDGKQHGQWRYYRWNILKRYFEYYEGKKLGIQFFTAYENNSFHSLFGVSEDTIQGIFVKYDEFGYLESFGLFEKNYKIGEWSYFKKGNLYSKGIHYSDYLHNIRTETDNWILVNKEGKDPTSVYGTNFEDYPDFNYNEYHLKDGKWEYYNEAGEIIREDFYDKGILIRSVEK